MKALQSTLAKKILRNPASKAQLKAWASQSGPDVLSLEGKTYKIEVVAKKPSP